MSIDFDPGTGSGSFTPDRIPDVTLEPGYHYRITVQTGGIPSGVVGWIGDRVREAVSVFVAAVVSISGSAIVIEFDL